jgi:quinol monooxygenase YgiN
MVRYFMSFAVPEGRQQTAQKIIDQYFDELYKNGPGGMRSQCYSDNSNDSMFIHIKSFKKEAVANQHFKSATFREYVQKLADLCGQRPGFSRLQQQQTFESIY